MLIPTLTVPTLKFISLIPSEIITFSLMFGTNHANIAFMKEADLYGYGDFLAGRPELLQGVENIDFPSRTSKRPTKIYDRKWLNYVNSNWPAFRMIAIERLIERPEDSSPEIDLLHFDPVSLSEKFVLPRSAIRINLGLKGAEDVRVAYQYFELGREVGRENEPIMDITRKELLQLHIVSYARECVVGKMQKSGFVYHKRPDSDFDSIDQLMRRKPKRGGPLFTI